MESNDCAPTPNRWRWLVAAYVAFVFALFAERMEIRPRFESWSDPWSPNRSVSIWFYGVKSEDDDYFWRRHGKPIQYYGTRHGPIEFCWDYERHDLLGIEYYWLAREN